MKKRVWNGLVWILKLGLFCGYFYILFTNLVCGFSCGKSLDRWGAIKVLGISLFLSIGFPGMIWYQYGQIRKLRKMLEKYEDFTEENSENKKYRG